MPGFLGKRHVHGLDILGLQLIPSRVSCSGSARAQAGSTDVLTLWAQGEERQGLWGLMHPLQGTAPGWTLTLTEFIFQGPHAWALSLINEGTWDKSLSHLSPSHDA